MIYKKRLPRIANLKNEYVEVGNRLTELHLNYQPVQQYNDFNI